MSSATIDTKMTPTDEKGIPMKGCRIHPDTTKILTDKKENKKNQTKESEIVSCYPDVSLNQDLRARVTCDKEEDKLVYTVRVDDENYLPFYVECMIQKKIDLKSSVPTPTYHILKVNGNARDPLMKYPAQLKGTLKGSVFFISDVSNPWFFVEIPLDLLQ